MNINSWLQIFLISAFSSRVCPRLWYPQCKGVHENEEKMVECCRIFGLSQSCENREYCAMSCLDGDSEFDYSIECCFEDCFANSSGIYRDKEFNYTALLFSVTWGGEVDEETLKIAEQSIETCKSKVKLSDNSPSYCNIPSYVYHLTQCVLTENYMNCPNVTSNSECGEFKSYLEKCNKVVTTSKPRATRKTTTKKITTRKSTTKRITKKITRKITTPKDSSGKPKKTTTKKARKRGV